MLLLAVVRTTKKGTETATGAVSTAKRKPTRRLRSSRTEQVSAVSSGHPLSPWRTPRLGRPL